ncbi:hypothetical protein [Hanstruepera ponticola]|uniref:hypothetical protein n=1 Tax=Hanstruepera ponticola TaxID=2042995 RepID=UPI00177D11A0|nr:hypothetical protein [Hanstruepera ponticola]
MQKFQLILILILTFNCSQNQTDKRILEFEKILGQKETKTLNLLVADFEKNLKKVYPDLTTEKAYRKYMTEFVSKPTTDLEKFKFLSDKEYSEFSQSELWKEVYKYDSSFDSRKVIQRNMIGRYMQALYSIKDSDSLIDEYFDKQEGAGMMQRELLVNGVLSFKPDFNDYFHKRIVVLEFSF